MILLRKFEIDKVHDIVSSKISAYRFLKRQGYSIENEYCIPRVDLIEEAKDNPEVFAALVLKELEDAVDCCEEEYESIPFSIENVLWHLPGPTAKKEAFEKMANDAANAYRKVANDLIEEIEQFCSIDDFESALQCFQTIMLMKPEHFEKIPR